MARSKQAAATIVSPKADARGAAVGYVLVAAVRFFLHSQRVHVVPVGDLLVTIQPNQRGERQWMPGDLKPKGRYAEQLAAAIQDSFSTWFPPEDQAAFRSRFYWFNADEVILGVAPVSRLTAGSALKPGDAAKQWRAFWPDDGPIPALDQAKSLLRQWLDEESNIEALIEGDAVLTYFGDSWPDRLVTAYQGREQKPEKDEREPEPKDGRLPPPPQPWPAEFHSPEQALSFLEARFPDPATPEMQAVTMLRSEFIRLSTIDQPISGPQQGQAKRRPLASGHLRPTDAARVAKLPDRDFFRQFAKLKSHTPAPELKRLLSLFLVEQAGQDFSEIADSAKRYQRKKDFADQVRKCAKFAHCKFRIESSGEIGNLTCGKSGTSASGQFQLYRKESGTKISLLASAEFPRLGLADA